MDSIALALILSKVASSLKTPQESCDFLAPFVEAKSKLSNEARLCLEMDIVVSRLKMGGKLAQVKASLEETSSKLQASSIKEPMVYSKYYRASAEYRKVAGPADEFLKHALLFLTYTPVEILHAQERYELATDIAMSAVCGDGVFNLGEVIATPIVTGLEGTPNGWLLDIIRALHTGDIVQFNAIVDANRDKYFAQPALAANHETIKKKAVLLCVLNIAFGRDPHDRSISFQEIATKAAIPLNQVEWVLMRALSIGIIRGCIDEVEGNIAVNWVQPRVLDSMQISNVSAQMKGWSDRYCRY